MTNEQSNLPRLPQGWVWTKFEEICKVLRAGGTPSTKIKEYYENGTIPFVKIKDIVNSKRYLYDTTTKITEEGLNNSSAWLVPKDSLLYSMYASYGEPIINGIEVATSQAIIAYIPPDNLMVLDYIYFYLKKIRPELKTRGTTQRNLNAQIVRNIPIPLPPLPEQCRIVRKIDELFSILDAGVESLKKIKTLSRPYRQAVVKYAVEGRLTEQWRKTHSDKIEPASALIERILRNRRATWETMELIKMGKKGQIPKDDSWKKKYKDPKAPDTSSLPDLPEGWIWISWNQISNWVTYGFTRPMSHVCDGIPIITAKNVINRKIDFENTDKTTREAFESLSEKDRPKTGDILITKDGTIGNAAVVPDQVSLCINQSVAVIWLRSCPLNRNYLIAVIESPITQRLIRAKARGVAIQHLSITDFAKMPLPLPPLEEQNIIAEEIERRISICDEVEKAVEQSLLQAESLRQSILKKAFEGNLDPQDLSEEPAEKLLDRIKVELAKGIGEGKIKKKNKTANIHKQMEFMHYVE